MGYVYTRDIEMHKLSQADARCFKYSSLD